MSFHRKTTFGLMLLLLIGGLILGFHKSPALSTKSIDGRKRLEDSKILLNETSDLSDSWGSEIQSNQNTISLPIYIDVQNRFEDPTILLNETGVLSNPPDKQANQNTTTKTESSDIPNPVIKSEYANPVVYRVTRQLTIENSNSQVDTFRFWMPSVIAWDSQTDITHIATIPGPTSVSIDEQYGNSIDYWEFHNEPAKGSAIVIKDEFTYTCYQIDYKVDTSKVGTYDKTSRDYQLFTRPEKYIESDDARIVEIAGQLQQDKTNPYEVAGAIYDWVIDNMTHFNDLAGEMYDWNMDVTYSQVAGLMGAKFAAEKGYGQCGDYASLFTALCRAAGIPARTVVGSTSYPDDLHIWAEFYLPGYGWLPVDTDLADRNGEGRAYFGNLDNKRLILHKGFNMLLDPAPIFYKPDGGCLPYYFWEFQGIQSELRIRVYITCTINPQPGSLNVKIAK